jgi:hypothetical protein
VGKRTGEEPVRERTVTGGMSADVPVPCQKGSKPSFRSRASLDRDQNECEGFHR